MDPPDTQNICLGRIEIFLQASEKKFSLQNRGKIKVRVRNSQPDFESDFSKSQLFSLFLRLNEIDASYSPNFFYERKVLIKADLSDTQNMCVRRIENFLQASEKKFSLQNRGKMQVQVRESLT